jgi:pyruvate/2-oxoglutarate/acetoin dehydrogenase E1 component
MHIADLSLGILGANGIVGGGIPIAAGAAWAQQHQRSGRIILCFFGDGAVNQGSFHEALNLSAVWRLPVVFVCENNQYAMGVSLRQAVNVEHVSECAAAYNMPGRTVDGNDVLAVYEAASEAAARARAGEGPTLVECQTYRHEGHHAADLQVYRTADEVAEWKKKDPLPRFRRHLLAEGCATGAELDEIEAAARAEVEAAIRYAEESPLPEPETVTQDVYFPQPPETVPPATSPTREMTFAEAINAAYREEMRRDERVVALGESIAVWGGSFQTTRGLLEEFGPERVRDTPLSEAAIAGAAVGAALTGLRPVATIMYIDFIGIALDQIVNQAAKNRYMFGGKATLPLVIETQEGGGTGSAAQHSQCLEAWFHHVPGLKVVLPSTPADAKGLFATAIRDDNPVVFIGHKLLFALKGPVPEGEYTLPFGVADVKREGRDVTIIALSYMVHKAMEAAEQLAAEGIEAEVVDPRTLAPLDAATLVQSVQKTHRALIVHEAVVQGGAGGEIAAVLADQAFDALDAPIRRIGALPCPMPYSRVLEEAVIPSVSQIVEEARRLVRYEI